MCHWEWWQTVVLCWSLMLLFFMTDWWLIVIFSYNSLLSHEFWEVLIGKKGLISAWKHNAPYKDLQVSLWSSQMNTVCGCSLTVLEVSWNCDCTTDTREWDLMFLIWYGYVIVLSIKSMFKPLLNWVILSWGQQSCVILLSNNIRIENSWCLSFFISLLKIHKLEQREWIRFQLNTENCSEMQ